MKKLTKNLNSLKKLTGEPKEVLLYRVVNNLLCNTDAKFFSNGSLTTQAEVMAHRGKKKFKAGRKDTAQLDDVENLLK